MLFRSVAMICVTIIATELEFYEKETAIQNGAGKKTLVPNIMKNLKDENVYAEPEPYQYRDLTMAERNEEMKEGAYRYRNKQEGIKIPAFLKQYTEVKR